MRGLREGAAVKRDRPKPGALIHVCWQDSVSQATDWSDKHGLGDIKVHAFETVGMLMGWENGALRIVQNWNHDDSLRGYLHVMDIPEVAVLEWRELK